MEFDDLKGNVLSILDGCFMSPEASEQNQQLISFLKKIEALHERCSSIAQSSIRTQLEQSSGKIYVTKHESSTSKTDFAMFYYVENQQEQIKITEINPVNKTVTSYYANDDDLALNYISLSELVNGAVFLNEVVTYDGHLEHIVCSCEGYAITINLEYGYRIHVGQFGKSQITDTVCSEKNVVSRENENVSGKLVRAIRAQLLTQVKKFKKAPSSFVKCHKPAG